MKKFKLWNVALALCIAMSSFLCACGNGGSTNVPRNDPSKTERA